MIDKQVTVSQLRGVYKLLSVSRPDLGKPQIVVENIETKERICVRRLSTAIRPYYKFNIS